MVGCFCRLSNTHSSADWETFTVNGQIYLVYANAKDNISQICIALVFILTKDSLLLVLILTKMTKNNHFYNSTCPLKVMMQTLDKGSMTVTIYIAYCLDFHKHPTILYHGHMHKIYSTY